jgi:hypothetical protein
MRYALAIAGLAAAAQAATYTHTETAEVTITSCAPTHTNCPYRSHTGNDWENWSSTTSATPAAATTSSVEWGSWNPSASTKTPQSTATGSWGAWNGASNNPVAAASATESWDAWNGASGKPAAAASVTGSWGAWSSVAASSTAPSCPKYTETAPPAWMSNLPTPVLSSLAAQWTGAAAPSDWCYYSYVQSISTVKTPVASSTPAAQSTWAAWSTGGSPVQGVAANTTTPIATFKGAANANAGSFVLAGAAAVVALVLA